MSKILQAGQTGFGILIENDAGFINSDLNPKFINESFELKENEPVLINCVLQKWGVKNKNGRIYPKEILIPQVEEYQQLVNSNSAVSEADHPDCVSASESMIYTKDGWKKFDDISEDEEILTLNPNTNQIEIQRIEKKIYEPYKGKMYRFEGKNLELTVTPNHRFLLEDGRGNRSYYFAKDIYENINNIFTSGKYKILKLNKSNKVYSEYLDNYSITEIDFNDNIACVTVPNSNFYVMVNGKSHWTGNSSIISLNNISHMITKMWWGKGDDENVLYGQIKVIVSPGFIKYGIASVIGDKIVLYLMNKIRLGISSRGVGSLKDINGENIVQNDFELIGFDLVSTPSTPGAYLFPSKNGETMAFGETFEKKNGIYIKEEEDNYMKIYKAINKFIL